MVDCLFPTRETTVMEGPAKRGLLDEMERTHSEWEIVDLSPRGGLGVGVCVVAGRKEPDK